jgi:NADH-quinone oxidoreductase subunit L
MLCVVCGIGFLITIFSAGYMKGDSGYFRFFAYLGLFIFMMTTLVMGENLVMLYLGWEGVGLCSYFLIGHYYDKPSARDAAKKAFIVNRIGDFGFALGIMLSFYAFSTISYFGAGTGTGTGLLEKAAAGGLSAFQQHALKWIPFLLMLGAFGKSAQFPLYVWLPDAMEGPTPVSALIHAATMVTAGVYMIARCGTLFVSNQAAMLTIACVGAFTALLAASIALRQFDLKKVFAYSTISQLGFMFVGVGVLAPVAGVFHLATHAFFKALLFLASGVVMHAMAGQLDMRTMSGLKSVLPRTRWLMLIGCAALAGFPFLAGFFSKDEIISASWDRSRPLAIVMHLAAFLTAYYTFRLYFRVFEGPEVIPEPLHPADGHGGAHGGHQPGGHDQAGHAQGAHDDHAPADARHNHEPAILILPLVILAIGAVLAGYLNYPDEHLSHFLGKSPSFSQPYDLLGRPDVGRPLFGQGKIAEKDLAEQTHHFHLMMMLVSGLIAVAGIYLAYVFHLKDRRRGDELAAEYPAITGALEHKWWVDEIYDAAIVQPLYRLSELFYAFDRFVVDGLIWGVSFIPQASGWVLKLSTQRGYLQGYAATMLLGVAVILIVIFL